LVKSHRTVEGQWPAQLGTKAFGGGVSVVLPPQSTPLTVIFRSMLLTSNALGTAQRAFASPGWLTQFTSGYVFVA
jgi:hypothetical protein